MFCLPSENGSALKERFFFSFSEGGADSFHFQKVGKFFTLLEIGANSFHFLKVGQILFIFGR